MLLICIFYTIAFSVLPSDQPHNQRCFSHMEREREIYIFSPARLGCELMAVVDMSLGLHGLSSHMEKYLGLIP